MKQKFIKAPQYKSLNPSELRWQCNPEVFDFDSTESIEAIEGIIGQERALTALQMGVEINSPGYNIFVTGLSGTGKATTIQKILERINPECKNLKDYVYVNNFSNENNPRLLEFPQGIAQQFAANMDILIDFLITKIPQVLESDTFNALKKSIIDEFANSEKELMSSFERKIKTEGFALGQVQVENYYRPEILPVINNKPVSIQELPRLLDAKIISEEQADKIVKDYQTFTIELQDIFKKGMKLSQEYQEKLLKAEQETVSLLVGSAIEGLLENFNYPKVAIYLEEVKNSVLNSLNLFKSTQKNNSDLNKNYSPEFRKYKVNVLLDNTTTTSCPVIIETSPNFSNLFGTIEKVYTDQGIWSADFMNIRAGSLLRANGGYIVLNALDTLMEVGVWRTLKRTLMYKKLEIQDISSIYQFSASALKPEPIDINTKVIFIGSSEIYNALISFEEDFKKIFKVRADFDYEMKNTNKALNELARLIKKLSEQENLLHFTKSAVAEIAEYSAKYVGKKNKLTTRFAVIADIAREADFWARKDSSVKVFGKHVNKAIDSYIQRHNLINEKIEEMILDNSLIIDTSGEKVGEINGLAVYGNNEYMFGKPSKITASVYVGSAGILNIEREAKLSGKTHDKGVLILSGFLREKFACKNNISFSASICFEQSYSGVDGDSASSTEVYALLSAISGIPVKQSIAVTGSVNQKGIIQPIGGVNEKIEGFFEICKKRGLDGSHGVLIPRQNVNDLMLNYDVIKAVKNKLFNIYAVDTIDQGIEILTGVKAGSQKDGTWEENTVYFYVDKRLKELTALAKGENGSNKTKKKNKIKR